MQAELIQYRGRYEYADAQTLERVLSSARETFEDEDVADVSSWLRFFVSRGTSLTVNMSVPACSEHRFVAANLFLVLAHGATNGSVEAVHGATSVDHFGAGDDD